MKSFDLKPNISSKLGDEIMEALTKLIQEKPHGRWFKYNLEFEFQAMHNTDESVTITALILKPKEEVVPQPDVKNGAGMHILKGSKEGAASFMKAVKELSDEEDDGDGENRE